MPAAAAAAAAWTDDPLAFDPAFLGAETTARYAAGAAQATMKLERLSKTTLTTILFFLYFMSASTLALGVVLCTCAYFISDANSTAYLSYSLSLGVLTIEGILRSAGCILLLFLLLAFPQRIIRDSIAMSSRASPEAILISVFVIFLSMTPAYSIWGLVDFWQQFAGNFADSFGQGLLLAITSASLVDDYSPAAYTIQVVCTCINLMLIFLFWGGLAYWQGHRYKVEGETDSDGDENAEEGGDSASRDRIQQIPPTMPTQLDDEADPEKGALGLAPDSLFISIQAQLISVKIALASLQKRMRRALQGLPLAFAAQLAIYLGMSLGLSLGFHFMPSQVPLVGIISVIRVCTAQPSEFTSTTLVKQDYPRVNTTTRVHVSLKPFPAGVTVNMSSLCEANISGSQVFWRALSVLFMFIAEVLLLYQVWILASASQRRLSTLPYAKTRAVQLTFTFFQFNTFQVWITVFVTSTIQLAVAPVSHWIAESVTVSLAPHQENITVINNPLFAVGVTPSTESWGPFFVMLCTWLVLMSYAYLPPDANGPWGWFFPTKPRKHKQAAFMAEPNSGHLSYFATEQECQRALDLVRLPHVASSGSKRILLRAMSKLGLSEMPSQDNFGAGLHGQIAARGIVLETEILLFNFVFACSGVPFTVDQQPPEQLQSPQTASDPSSDSLSLQTWPKKPTPLLPPSPPKKQIIQDNRFTLRAQFQDKSTLCIVCSSADRVVVTLRYGKPGDSISDTVGKSSDFAISGDLVLHPLALAVAPILDHGEHGKLAVRAASSTPMCHRGLLEAYSSIQDNLRGVIKLLLAEDSKRVVFVTGHSLGGALAALASFDLAVSLDLDSGSIALTTFGAPKIGNFSFVRRVARKVPSARRIAMAGDLVTKLPLGMPFEDWFFTGWEHVGTENLLDVTGNWVIRPSPTERIMLQRDTSSLAHHELLAYATAVMAWAIRSHEDQVQFDWWIGLIDTWWVKGKKRLNFIAPGVRERLMADMMRTGATYFNGKNLVRDYGVEVFEEDQPGSEVSALEKFDSSWVEMRLLDAMDKARERGDRKEFRLRLGQLKDVRMQSTTTQPSPTIVFQPPNQADTESLLAAMQAAMRARNVAAFDALVNRLAETRNLTQMTQT